MGEGAEMKGLGVGPGRMEGAMCEWGEEKEALRFKVRVWPRGVVLPELNTEC